MADEDCVPYDRSDSWRAHDAYFHERGVSAWTGGDIPYLSTNNLAVARQQATLLVAHVEALIAAGGLAPDELVPVLEVGGGMGTFAGNFHHALDEHLGDAGRRLAARLRYLFTDYAPDTVAQASAGGELAPLVAAGRVVPLRYDLRAPGELIAPPGKIVAVLANYVACVVGTKHLQRRADGLAELCVRGNATLEWRPASLDALFANPLHRRVLVEVVGAEPLMTVSVPHVFLDFLDGVRPLMHPGGLVLVTDFGKVSTAQLRGLRDPKPTFYGESLNHDVHFPVLDAHAALTGAHVLRTNDPLLALHTALISPSPIAPAVAAAFRATLVDRHDGQELLDMVAAARTFLERHDWTRAVRFFARAIALDPRNAELRLRLGIAHLEAGRHVEAVDELRAGAALDHWRSLDFDFELGRAYSKLGQYPDAIHAYQLSLARDPHPTTYTNLGTVHDSLGHERAAYRCYKHALRLDPNDELARGRLALLKEAWWERRLVEFDDPT